MIGLLISASVLILVIILLRRVFRGKISMRVQYALWMLVAIRLLVPFEFGSSPLSLQNLTPSTRTEQPVKTEPMTQTLVPQATDVPVFVEPSVDFTPIVSEPAVSEPIASAPVLPEETLFPYKPILTEPAVTEEAFDWERFAVIAWAVGAGVMAFWFITVNVRFRIQAKKHARQVQIEGYPLPVFVTNEIPSPCLVGLLRSKVYLTPIADANARAHVLTHELTHYRHLDPVWSLVRAVCLCLYWFHPLIWWAAVLSKRDCELACDEGALKKLGEAQRIPYGDTLLSMVARVSRLQDLANTATTMSESKKQLKERVEMIVKRPKKLLIALLCLILLIGITVGCTFTGAETEETTTEPTETTELTESTKPTESLDSDRELVVTHYEDANYRIPQIATQTKYDKVLNDRILSTFGCVIDGETGGFTSIDYSYTIHGNILSVLVIAENGTNVPIYESYNTWIEDTAATGDYEYPNLVPEEDHDIVAERFVVELTERYKQTGSFSFDEATVEIWERNRFGGRAIWLDAEGKTWASYVYYPLSGTGAERITLCLDEYEAPAHEWETEPQVVELYRYDGVDYYQDREEICSVPFLMMSGERALQINTELLRMHTPNLTCCDFSWSVHGDILSLLVHSVLDYDEYRVYNLSVSRGTDVPSETVYTAAGYTRDSFTLTAQKAIEIYYFNHWNVSESFIPLDQHYTLAASSSGAVNASQCVPYLDGNGKLWILAKLYQIAGSSSAMHLIPIDGGEITQEYLDFVNLSRTPLQLVPSFNQSGYDLLPEPNEFEPGMIRFPRELTDSLIEPGSLEDVSKIESYPIYVDPYPTGQVGAVYEQTEELLAIKEANLQSYLKLLYGEGSYNIHYEETEMSDSAAIVIPVYTDEAVEIKGNKYGVSIMLTGAELSSEEGLLDLPAYQAALRYTGITKPVLSDGMRYSEPNSFSATMRDESDVYDKARPLDKEIRVVYDAETQILHIHAYCEQTLTQVSRSNEINLWDIIETVTDYRDCRMLDFKVEVFYSSQVVLGYYVPCYRFYVPAEMINGTRYCMVFELCEARFPTNHTKVQPWVD